MLYGLVAIAIDFWQQLKGILGSGCTRDFNVTRPMPASKQAPPPPEVKNHRCKTCFSKTSILEKQAFHSFHGGQLPHRQYFAGVKHN